MGNMNHVLGAMASMGIDMQNDEDDDPELAAAIAASL